MLLVPDKVGPSIGCIHFANFGKYFAKNNVEARVTARPLQMVFCGLVRAAVALVHHFIQCIKDPTFIIYSCLNDDPHLVMRERERGGERETEREE